MKNKTTLILVSLLIVIACRKAGLGPGAPINMTADSLTLPQVRAWYLQQSRQMQHPGVLTGLNIDLSKAENVKQARGNWWVCGIGGQPSFRGVRQGYRKVLFYRDARGAIQARLLEIIPDALYFQAAGKVTTATFTGRVFIYDQRGSLEKGLVFAGGRAIGRIRPKSGNQLAANATHDITVIQTCDWYDDNYVDADNHAVIYSEYDCDYTIDDDGADDIGGGTGPATGSDYLGSTSTGTTAAPPRHPISRTPTTRRSTRKNT